MTEESITDLTLNTTNNFGCVIDRESRVSDVVSVKNQGTGPVAHEWNGPLDHARP